MSLQNIPNVSENERIDALEEIKKRGIRALLHLPPKIKDDKETIISVIKLIPNDSNIYRIISPRLQNDRDIFLLLLKNNSVSSEVPTQFHNDREIVLTALSKNVSQFVSLPDNMKDDHEIVLFVVSLSGFYLQFASKNMRNNREIVLAAINSDAQSLEFASNELRKDREIVIAAALSRATTQPGIALQYTPLNDDHEIVLTIVRIEGYALKYASDRLKDDNNIVLAAVNSDGESIKYASDRLKDNNNIVLAAVNNNGKSIKYASDRLYDDHDIVLAVVKNNGDLINFVSDRLKDNYDIVLEAVKNNGESIKYASDRLKDNYDIVLAAVKNNGESIKYVSDRFKDDYNLFFYAIYSYPDALEYAFDTLKNNRELIFYSERVRLQTGSKFLNHHRPIKINNDHELLLNNIALPSQPNISTVYTIDYDILLHKLTITLMSGVEFEFDDIAADAPINSIAKIIYNKIHLKYTNAQKSIKQKDFFLSYKGNFISPFDGKMEIQQYIQQFNHTGGYYQKYIKYKQKYEKLKNKNSYYYNKY